MLLHLGPTDGVSNIKRTNVTKNKKDMQSVDLWHTTPRMRITQGHTKLPYTVYPYTLCCSFLINTLNFILIVSRSFAGYSSVRQAEVKAARFPSSLH